jgi:hypothetical protein
VRDELDLLDGAAERSLPETKTNQLEDQHQIQSRRCGLDVLSVKRSALEMKRQLDRSNRLAACTDLVKQRMQCTLDREQEAGLIFVWRIDLKRNARRLFECVRLNWKLKVFGKPIVKRTRIRPETAVKLSGRKGQKLAKCLDTERSEILAELA